LAIGTLMLVNEVLNPEKKESNDLWKRTGS